MVVADLFEHIADFNAIVKRNIVSLRQSEDLFDDLHGGDETLANIAIDTENFVKPDSPPMGIDI